MYVAETVVSILVSSYLLSCVVRYEMSDSESGQFVNAGDNEPPRKKQKSDRFSIEKKLEVYTCNVYYSPKNSSQIRLHATLFGGQYYLGKKSCL